MLRSPTGSPYTPISPNYQYADEDAVKQESPLREVSFAWHREDAHKSSSVRGLKAVVPSDAYAFNMSALEQNQALVQEYMHVKPEDKLQQPTRTLSSDVLSGGLLLKDAPPKSPIIQRPASAPEANTNESRYQVTVSEHKYEHTDMPTSSKTVRESVNQRILARPEDDSYRSYCTRSVKGLRLTSPDIRPRRIQDPIPEPAPYTPNMRSRTQRRKDEQEAELRRKEEAERDRGPVRRNPDGTPMYATVSHHKEEFDQKILLDMQRQEKYDLHVKRIRQDRESLLQIKGTDGILYMYNERGFKVIAAEYVKPRVRTPPKVIYTGPYFTGEIIKKTASHVENMRRMIKLRYEHAKWDSCTMPCSTYTPGKGVYEDVYVPLTVTPGSSAHRDELKYGNAYGKQVSKGGGHHGKVYGGSRAAQSFRDLDILPLSYARPWPEYAALQSSDVCVTIEHCHSCHRHNFKTRHKPEKYLSLAREFRQIIIRVCSQFVCRLDIYLKPIKDHDPFKDFDHHHSLDYSELLNGNPGKSGGDKNSFTRVDVMEKVRFETQTNRCGAFEIQVALRTPDGKILQHILFSKLFFGAWPSKQSVATNLDHLLSENLMRLPEELPVHLYEKQLADVDACRNVLDSRNLGDFSAFEALRLEVFRKVAHDALIEKHAREAEAIRSEETTLETEVESAAKRAKTSKMKLTSARNAHEDGVRQGKEKALAAAMKQHKAWGATFDEAKWKQEYEATVKSSDESLEILAAEKSALEAASHLERMQALFLETRAKRLDLTARHGRELATGENGPGVKLSETAPSVVKSDAVENTRTAQETETPAPDVIARAALEAAAVDAGERETAARETGAVEAEKRGLQEMESKLRADIQADLERKLQQEFQGRLEASLRQARTELESALQQQMEAKLSVERQQLRDLEAELLAVRKHSASREGVAAPVGHSKVAVSVEGVDSGAPVGSGLLSGVDATPSEGVISLPTSKTQPDALSVPRGKPQEQEQILSLDAKLELSMDLDLDLDIAIATPSDSVEAAPVPLVPDKTTLFHDDAFWDSGGSDHYGGEDFEEKASHSGDVSETLDFMLNL